MAPVAWSANESRTVAVEPTGRSRPSWSSRLELFVQRALTARPSTVNLPIEVSSSKARGVTDRLTLLIGPPDVFLITIFSVVDERAGGEAQRGLEDVAGLDLDRGPVDGGR